jgi:hypothetical protein
VFPSTSSYSAKKAFVFGKDLSIEDRKTTNQGIAEMNKKEES